MAKFVSVPESLITALEGAGIISNRLNTRRVTIVIDAIHPAMVTVEQFGDDGEIEHIVKVLKVDEAADAKLAEREVASRD